MIAYLQCIINVRVIWACSIFAHKLRCTQTIESLSDLLFLRMDDNNVYIEVKRRRKRYLHPRREKKTTLFISTEGSGACLSGTTRNIMAYTQWNIVCVPNEYVAILRRMQKHLLMRVCESNIYIHLQKCLESTALDAIPFPSPSIHSFTAKLRANCSFLIIFCINGYLYDAEGFTIALDLRCRLPSYALSKPFNRYTYYYCWFWTRWHFFCHVKTRTQALESVFGRANIYGWR